MKRILCRVTEQITGIITTATGVVITQASVVSARAWRLAPRSRHCRPQRRQFRLPATRIITPMASITRSKADHGNSVDHPAGHDSRSIAPGGGAREGGAVAAMGAVSQ